MSILQAIITAPLMSGEGGPPPPPTFEPIDSLQSLGITWTVELVVEPQPSQYWAVLWGNEIYDNGLGHFAYFGSTTNLNVGSPSGQNEYTVSDIGARAHWVFTHTNGGGVSVYRNGVLLTPDVTNYVQSSVATNTLLWGGRHNNNGIGFTDTLPGNYLYTNIRTTALDAAGVVSAYNALSGSYGLTPIPDVSGTITVGTNAEFGTRYGYSSSFLIYGSISATPAAIPLFFTDPGLYTRVQFNGTTIGTTPTDSMMGTATGVTSLSVTVDGITQTLTTGGPSAGGYSIAGDPFGFATKNGQTLSFTINLL